MLEICKLPPKPGQGLWAPAKWQKAGGIYQASMKFLSFPRLPFGIHFPTPCDGHYYAWTQTFKLPVLGKWWNNCYLCWKISPYAALRHGGKNNIVFPAFVIFLHQCLCTKTLRGRRNLSLFGQRYFIEKGIFVGHIPNIRTQMSTLGL